MLLRILCLLIIVISPLSSAQAADINAEGAAQLKQMFQSYLDRYKTKYSDPEEGHRLEYDGDLLVEQAESHYAITLPITRIYFQAEENGVKKEHYIALSMISINAKAGDKPKEWKMSFALPTPISGYDDKDQEKFSVHIGSQSASGIWHEDFNKFVQLTAHFNDIRSNMQDAAGLLRTDNATIHTDNVTINYDLKQNEQGRWSGPSNIKISGFTLTAPNKSNALNVREISINTSSDKLSAEKSIALEDLITVTANATAENPVSNTLPIFDTVLSLINGGSAQFDIKGLSVKKGVDNEIAQILDMSLTPAKDVESIELGQAGLHLSFSGLMEDILNTSISFNYNDLKIKPITGADENLIPEYFDISLNKNNIPIKQIATILRNELAANGKINPLTAIIKIPAILSTSGTNLDIHSKVGNQNYGIVTGGTLKADITAANGFTANAETRITNLSTLIEYVGKKAQDGENKKSSFYKELLDTLKILIQKGIAEQGPNGETVHTFTYVLDEKGEMLLNGEPAMPIFSQLKFPKDLF